MLALIRSMLHMAWMVITVMPWTLAVLLVSLVAPRTAAWWTAVNWFRVVMWGTRHILGVRMEVQGMQHLPLGQTSAASLRASEADIKSQLAATQQQVQVLGQSLAARQGDTSLDRQITAARLALTQRQEVLAYCQAKPADGGEGALIVLLRNQK